MAFIRADRVKDTTTTTGTGAVTVSGTAPTGFRTFSAVCATNDTVPYCIVGGAEWEVGVGTYSASNQITRTTVLASSNGGSAVNFSAGTKDVFITKPAGRDVDSDQLASTAANLGASLVGIEDVGAYFADANVEDVLQAIGAVLDAIGPATWQIFTSSGTWTKPTGCKIIFVLGQGGGGAGGGAATTAAGQSSAGDGGGAGGLSIKRIDVTAISTVTVTIGAGGTGVAGGTGNSGGATTFGAHLTANGGSGGVARGASASTLIGAGAGGGTASSGDLNYYGNAGLPGARSAGTNATGGAGGSSIFGGIGTPPFVGTGTGAGTAARNNSGSGGSGAANGPSQGSTATGGAGGSGIVIVLELY